jgi:hypothetical protein
MWSKILKPAPVQPIVPASARGVATATAPSPVRPARVLQSSRTPQQLSFEFRRG